jgi:hypothetical protein
VVKATGKEKDKNVKNFRRKIKIFIITDNMIIYPGKTKITQNKMSDKIKHRYAKLVDKRKTLK